MHTKQRIITRENNIIFPLQIRMEERGKEGENIKLLSRSNMLHNKHINLYFCKFS